VLDKELLSDIRTVVEKPDYSRGLLCEYMGLNTTDMTRTELIEFIGMLDRELTEARIRAGLA
jgi:hypothetical protein